MRRSVSNLFSSISILSLRGRPTSSPSRIFTVTSIRSSSSSSSSIRAPYIQANRIVFPPNSVSNTKVDFDWTPPRRVSCIFKDFESYTNRFDYYYSRKAGRRHRLVLLHLYGVEVDTEKEMNEFYIKTLAYALGSEEEAKRRIYLVSYRCCYGFGAEFDFEELKKLRELTYVWSITGDLDHHDRKKDPNDKSEIHFSPLNLNFRYNNIFSYHHLSERNSKWNSDHWLISIKQFNCLPKKVEFDGLCVKLLAEVVGSEKAAMKKIYAVWYKSSFGFAAEIDEEAAKKLQGMADVFKVFPDYAFDVKRRCIYDGLVLQVCGPPYDLSFSSYHPDEDSGRLVSLEGHGGEYDDSTGSRLIRAPFIPINQMHPYNNIFNYHYMNRMNSNWSFDRWLIVIKQRDDECYNEQRTVNFCIRTLAKAVGSEKEAKSKIYIVWCMTPFGFGAEVDEETSNILKGLPDVLVVLPDYRFDVDNRNCGALVISRSPFKETNMSVMTYAPLFNR